MPAVTMAPTLFSGRAPFLVLALLPVVAPAAYLWYFSWNVSKTSTSCTGRRLPGGSEILPWKPVSLPEDVSSDDSEWILAYERVISNPVPSSNLAFSLEECTDGQPSALMRAYSRATHTTFASTPQAFLMRASISDIQAKRTFDKDWIQGLMFGKGDLVNGAYKVSYHGKGKEVTSERVELMIEAPPSYQGPVPRGLILAEVERVNNGENIVFVNETWMWRRQDEKPTLIENPVGAKIHALVAGWLVKRGIESITAKKSKSS